MGTKIDKRPCRFEVRLSQVEFEVLKSKSADAGLSPSEFIRRRIMDEKIVAAPPVNYFELIREVKRVGSNLNQLLHKLNALGIVHDLELKRCESEIHETVKVLYQAFRPEKGVG